MERITRGVWQKGDKRVQYKEFIILSKMDVDINEYPHWHNAVTGIKVRTDDGYVVDCFKARHFSTRNGDTKKEVILSIGKFIVGVHELLWEKKREVGNYSGSGYKTTEEKMKGQKKVMLFAKLAAKQLVETGRIDYDRIGKEVGIVGKYYKRREVITKMIQEEVDKLLKEVGLDGKEILDMYMDGYTVAKKNMDSANMIRVAENLAKMKGMFSKESKQIHSVGYMVTNDVNKIIDEFEEQETKYLAKPEIEE